MNVTRTKRSLSSILCMVLIAATALSTTGCSNETQETPSTESTVYAASETPHALGEGETTFPFSVVDLAGEEVQFTISTDETTVGAALMEAGLIEGEMGQYGLMVNIVNGQRLVYEEDKAYWAFYIDGAYAMSGVDSTDIVEGQSYAFRAEKA